MTNPYAPPAARVDDVVAPTTEAAPRLWNPNAAVNWSLLFSPAFGAWLHMKNWEALGEPQKAKAAKTWIVISLGLIVALSLASGLMPDSKGLDAATRSFGLVLLISWYVSAGRGQATLVKQRFGKDYPRRGWTQPLLWAVGATIAFFALVFVLAFAAGMAGAE
ncbi:MAG: hypothetical protein ABI887_14795 [Burkholderiales bacterium]